MLCFRFPRWIEFLQWLFQTGFFHWSEKQKKWLLVALYRWLSYAVTILWELTWAGSAMVVLDKWSFYIGGQISGFGCNYQEKTKLFNSFAFKTVLPNKKWSAQCSFLFCNFLSISYCQNNSKLGPGKSARAQQYQYKCL